MEYMLAFLLVAAFVIPASFSMEDDAVLAFTKQAAEDMPVYKVSLEKKTEVLKTLAELKEKADQLLQKRQDTALQSSVQALAGKVLELAPDYLAAETKSMETAKSNIHLVKELEDSLKKHP